MLPGYVELEEVHTRNEQKCQHRPQICSVLVLLACCEEKGVDQRVTESYSQTASQTLCQSISFPLPPKGGKKRGNSAYLHWRMSVFAGCRPSHLTVVAGPAGHVLLGLHVAAGAQRLHPGLGDDCAHNFTLHGDERIPVARNLLVRSQLELAGERMGMIHGCKGKRKG